MVLYRHMRRVFHKHTNVWYTGYNCNGMSNSNSVRIGCASGFWGDTAVAAPQLVNHGKIDFLVLDYLSEITMSLLTAAKLKSPQMGYAPDFVQAVVAPFLTNIKTKGVRIVSNAGGINPASCAAALAEVAKKADIHLKIAVVTGDDILANKDELKARGIKDMFTGAEFPLGINSMTAYLGAGPIKVALDSGADVVVTGRCTDSALVLGPLMHKFKWGPENYDLLATGSLAGHLIECGAQVTGGTFTDWHTVPDWHNIGFPIVDCTEDGSFIVTKPPNTGGLVSQATCSEQLVYEIGDPANYILPDVVCDFSKVQFEAVEGREGEAVRVRGVKGKPPTNDYKVCATYLDGYRLNAVVPIGGPKSAAKARKTVEAILRRTRGIYKMLGMEDFRRVNLQILGAEDTYGPHAHPGDGPREVVAWMAVHHNDKRALQLLAREIAPAGTGMAPGLTGIAGGRPKVSPILKLFSFLEPKSNFQINIAINGNSQLYKPHQSVSTAATDSAQGKTSHSIESAELPSGSHSFRLEELAYTRSGDKGNNCNIGVIARHPTYVPYLREALTAEAVDKYMAHTFEDSSGPVESRVTRYEMTGINGFNFVLHNSLGGGGVASLRSDPQGKAFGQMLLDFTIDNVPDLIKGTSCVNS